MTSQDMFLWPLTPLGHSKSKCETLLSDFYPPLVIIDLRCRLFFYEEFFEDVSSLEYSTFSVQIDNASKLPSMPSGRASQTIGPIPCK